MIRKPFLKLLMLAVCTFAFAANNSNGIAEDINMDAIFFNGNIITLDATDSRASAVAVRGGKIVKLGTSEEIRKLAGPLTKMVDLEGKTVLPGLIDAHCHPMETIYMKEDWVDCRYPGIKSVKQALENIAACAKNTPKGKWIFVACVSASENKFVDKRLPTRPELDKAAPNNPVLLANGTHQGVANTMALEVLGVKEGMTKLPGGGSVILDKDGEPTGVLADAQGDVPAQPSLEELERYYSKSIQEFWNQHGFTSLMAITPAQAVPVLQSLARSGHKPTIRFSVSVWTSANGKDMPDDLSKFYMPKGVDPSWYKFVAIKDWVDGENDARTGYMCEPYVGHFDTDPSGGHGTLVTEQPEADRFAEIARKGAIICMFHCSGDKATDIGLNAYEKMLQSGEPTNIFRIEHFGMFQLTDRQLERAKRMKSKGLHVSTQPIWLLELVKADYENMGPRRAHTGFQFRTMIDAGLEPTASSDMTGIYLGNINPFEAMYATVSRESDRGLFVPDQAISVTEAIKMWTIWAAKSMGEDKSRGTLEPGKLADMTVISDDIFSIPKEKIKDIKPIKTIVGGKVVYEAK